MYSILQIATKVYYKLRQLIYYKLRQIFITNCDSFFITNWDKIITNCDSYYKLRQNYYKLRQLLQIATIITNCDRTYELQSRHNTYKSDKYKKMVQWRALKLLNQSCAISTVLFPSNDLLNFRIYKSFFHNEWKIREGLIT